MKTSELTGAALDWAVAKAKGMQLKKFEKRGPWYYAEGDGVYRFIVGYSYSPSTDWLQGGSIIEREKMDIKWIGINNCRASIDWLGEERFDAFGHTPLVAAMRAYVASKMGEEVDIPAELED